MPKKTFVHVRDAGNPAAEGASLQVKLFLPFPTSLFSVSQRLKIQFSPNLSCLALLFSRPSLRAEAVCLGFCCQGEGETAVLRGEPVSQRYWLSPANVSSSTQCRSRGLEQRWPSWTLAALMAGACPAHGMQSELLRPRACAQISAGNLVTQRGPQWQISLGIPEPAQLSSLGSLMVSPLLLPSRTQW